MTEIGDNRLAVLSSEIRTHHAGVKAAAKVAADHAIAAGKALIEAKALVGHGEWLPWLKANCGFAERTAQAYMKIAEKGLPAETVAALGLKAALGAIVIEDHGYDPFAGCDEQQRKDWMLLACYQGNWQFVEWIIQRPFASPEEWTGPAGDGFRRICGMHQMSAEFKAGWQDYHAGNRDRPEGDISRELGEIEQANWKAHLEKPSRPRRRSRKSAPVADLPVPQPEPQSDLAERLRAVMRDNDPDRQRAEIGAIAAELDARQGAAR